MEQTYKRYYERYKGIVGSSTAQQAININNEPWNSFSRILKAKKEGRLPPFTQRKKLSPPGY